jgi:excisionase family DNA binding protein
VSIHINDKVYLSVTEAAERAAVTKDTIYRWCKDEVITCAKRRRGVIRYTLWVEEDSLEKYLKMQID